MRSGPFFPLSLRAKRAHGLQHDAPRHKTRHSACAILHREDRAGCHRRRPRDTVPVVELEQKRELAQHGVRASQRPLCGARIHPTQSTVLSRLGAKNDENDRLCARNDSRSLGTPCYPCICLSIKPVTAGPGWMIHTWRPRSVPNPAWAACFRCNDTPV